MKRAFQIKLLLILTLAILATSCGGGATKPGIEQAGLYLDPEGMEATTSYSWIVPFYLIVKTTNAQENTVIQASWIAMDTNRLEPETVLKIEEKTPDGDQVFFYLTNDGQFWPIGDYQVNLYINGKLAEELKFEVYHTEDVY
jgi:hypothetical protein